jgi:hypothetical protein
MKMAKRNLGHFLWQSGSALRHAAIANCRHVTMIGTDGIAAVYPPKEPVDLDDLADMLSCIVDGGIIMSKTLNDPSSNNRFSSFALV